jgi:(p)ppGpp synthase/HD superfamily hydrolase
MQRREKSYDEIYDLMAVRVIVETGHRTATTRWG